MARDTAHGTRGGIAFARLPASHWTVLRCAGDATRGAPVDEVLLGPSGVYVIVRRPGALEIDLAAARAAAARVACLVPPRYRDRLVPVLCMTDDDPVAQPRDDVLVTGVSTLEHVARSSPPVLSTSEVHGLSRCLARALEPLPEASDRPARRRVPLAALACVATTAAVLGVPWMDDTWQLLLRGTAIFG